MMSFTTNHSSVKTCTIVLFWLLPQICLSQKTVNSKSVDFDTNEMNKVDEQLTIKKNNGKPLKAGKYIYNYESHANTYPITFTINDEGRPDGVIALAGRFKVFVSNGKIYRYEIHEGQALNRYLPFYRPTVTNNKIIDK